MTEQPPQLPDPHDEQAIKEWHRLHRLDYYEPCDGIKPKGEAAMITREIAEQTLWCVRRAADEQVPCRSTCPVPCDLPDHVNPTEELVRFWTEQVEACVR